MCLIWKTSPKFENIELSAYVFININYHLTIFENGIPCKNNRLGHVRKFLIVFGSTTCRLCRGSAINIWRKCFWKHGCQHQIFSLLFKMVVIQVEGLRSRLRCEPCFVIYRDYVTVLIVGNLRSCFLSLDVIDIVSVSHSKHKWLIKRKTLAV